MSLFSLENKRILVTGASSGIGREIAQQVNAAGAHVIITGRNSEKLNETSSDFKPGTYTSIVCDLTNEQEIATRFKDLEPVDGIVHCAGIVVPYPTAFLNRNKINETFDTNFIAPVLLNAFLQHRKKINKESSLVFMSSISVDFPYEGGAMYACSKAALEAYRRSLALELVKQKIRSNCIAPALIKTPMYERADKNMFDVSIDERVGARYLLGIGMPADVAGLTMYLLSDASRWVTGKKFTIDGGLLLSSAK